MISRVSEMSNPTFDLYSAPARLQIQQQPFNLYSSMLDHHIIPKENGVRSFQNKNVCVDRNSNTREETAPSLIFFATYKYFGKSKNIKR